MPTAEIPESVSAKGLAALLDVSVRHLSRLSKADIVIRNENGSYPVTANVGRYIAYAVDGERRKAADTSGDRLREQRRLALERDMARDDRKLVDIEEATETLDEVIALVVEAFEALPRRATSDRSAQLKIQAVCDAIRGELADGLSAKASTLRTGK
ncbi:hypothetical protein [Aureimonas pseudogalii]|uniref:Phage terminase Nu1 subunit (DNA packaging protein) n=1 Tax=Aureimonas pseudogalii TaxID=1744844 RepID=A0A7W6MJT4_9HYPH|nr:hypothetical protein [Aureimonas pseudogalii]MBB3998623.1 phage terminase Nu1 subunit (DNA packaging protein) [Aureimonas pseudogalii]